MNQDEILEGIGRNIIKSLNDHNQEEALDDVEYIALIKRIILAIETYSERCEAINNESNAIQRILFNYSKELYVELCQKHAKEDGEDITMEEVQEDAEEIFSFIYEHDERPI